MSTTDRVTVVLDRAASTNNTALAAVITRARALTDDEAATLHRHLRATSDAARATARRVIDYAAIDQSQATGERDLIGQIAEAGDAGWYAAGEASGEAANTAAATGKWSPMGESETDQAWMQTWGDAWQAVSDAARVQAASALLAGDAVERHHYEALNGPWQALVDQAGAGGRDGLMP